MFLECFFFYLRPVNFFLIPNLYTWSAVLSCLFTVENVINSLSLDLISGMYSMDECMGLGEDLTVSDVNNFFLLFFM